MLNISFLFNKIQTFKIKKSYNTKNKNINLTNYYIFTGKYFTINYECSVISSELNPLNFLKQSTEWFDKLLTSFKTTKASETTQESKDLAELILIEEKNISLELPKDVSIK